MEKLSSQLYKSGDSAHNSDMLQPPQPPDCSHNTENVETACVICPKVAHSRENKNILTNNLLSEQSTDDSVHHQQSLPRVRYAGFGSYFAINSNQALNEARRVCTRNAPGGVRRLQGQSVTVHALCSIFLVRLRAAPVA